MGKEKAHYIITETDWKEMHCGISQWLFLVCGITDSFSFLYIFLYFPSVNLDYFYNPEENKNVLIFKSKKEVFFPSLVLSKHFADCIVFLYGCFHNWPIVTVFLIYILLPLIVSIFYHIIYYHDFFSQSLIKHTWLFKFWVLWKTLQWTFCL